MDRVAVTITSDLICPWCWVGLRKLEAAAQAVGVALDIEWKPFFLRPGTPEAGVPKGGSPESRVPARLKAAGADVGIDFTGLTDRTPSTALFHATMKLLAGGPAQTKFQEEAFANYFTRGIFPDKDGLLDAARRAGLETEVANLYNNPKQLDELKATIAQEARDASRLGISGVPTFAFDGVIAFSGAQDPQVFASYLRRHAKPATV